MKLIVREHVSRIIEPIRKIYNVSIDPIDTYGKISQDIGIRKGDLIIYRGAGDPVRFGAGNAAGKVLTTAPDEESGWTLSDAGSGTSAALVTLTNGAGVAVAAGTVVRLDNGGIFVKAEAGDLVPLYVSSDDCASGETVRCYGVRGTICYVLCTAAAVAAGDDLILSDTPGLLAAASDLGDRVVAVALSAKESGETGLVKALLRGDVVYGNAGMRLAAYTGMDVTAAPEENLSAKPVVWYDKAGNMIGHIELEQGTNDRYCFKFGIRRYIDDAWTWKQLRFYVESDGNTYLDTDGLYQYQDYILSDVSLPNGTEKEVGTITLKRGAYIVTITGSFVTNSSGYRKIALEGTGAGYLTMVQERACADIRTVIGKSFPINVNNETVFTLKAQQNSGGALVVSPRIRVMKIA